MQPRMSAVPEKLCFISIAAKVLPTGLCDSNETVIDIIKRVHWSHAWARSMQLGNIPSLSLAVSEPIIPVHLWRITIAIPIEWRGYL